MKKQIILLILSAFAILTSCSVNETNKTPSITATPASSKPELVLPMTENTSGKVQIQTVSRSENYPINSYIITSRNGETVVVDPTMMPKKDTVDLNPVTIASTHTHNDHIDEDYTDSYDCKKLLYVKDDIKTNDFHIYSILTSHSSDVINTINKNVMVVFEVDGLRIVHMGDIGQTFLTDEQVKELGSIDIAFMQFENTYSDMSLENEKGFKLIEQLNPKVVIPTHYTDAALPVIEGKYGKITEYNNILQISKEDLPKKPLTFFHITNTHNYY